MQEQTDKYKNNEKSSKRESISRDADEKYLIMFKNAPEGIFQVTPGGKFIMANPAMSAILGYKSPRHLMDSVQNVWTQLNVNQDAYESLKNFLDKYEAISGFEIQLYHRDGRKIWVSKSVRTVRDEDGSIKYYEGFMQDITERKWGEKKLNETLAELEQSNRELEQFAYIASHDLQEPLRKVTAFGDCLKRHSADVLDGKSLNYLNRMQNAAIRMKQLIEGLLKYSRITTRARPLEEVDLNNIVKGILSDLEAHIKKNNAVIEQGELPIVKADKLQIKLLFQNLISNALKFSRPGINPLIAFSSRIIEGQLVEIQVKDNGIGFREKYLDRIFKPFQRLHTRDEYPGIGMGLSICKKIVERHGGQITAKSKPKEWATFLITLPMTEKES
ncbi:MAG: PAS domain S-box protein [Candidatus Eremiobacteraeota bacterium]|nr:PAS domain S-box protein [Candidatus Eremiobacteraeota bacterium]